MFEKLFEPMMINRTTIKNRLMVPAMVTNLADTDGMCTEALRAYHEAKARGGWGLILTEDYAVAPEGRGYERVPGLWSDEQRESHRAIPQAIHQYEGAKVFAQIYHCGRQTRPDLNGGTQPVAPSPIPCPACRCMPRALEIEEIELLVTRFAGAAVRAKDAGFDGIEIHGGHGYLIAQFMSPYSNKRIDAYGGSLMGRMRFPLEILAAVRARVGEDFPIGFRISADEMLPGGRTLEETLVIAHLLEQNGVDVLNVSVGAYGTPAVVAPMHFAHGWIVEYAEKVKREVNIPVIAVNRITDPLMAERIVAMGRADLVAMGRASLADPELPKKASSEQSEQIRSCIGCIVCDNSLVRGQHIRCSVNPTLAYEHEGPLLPAQKPKTILVAGAGPAGMEAARIAALRGHDVTVFERETLPGGQFRAAPFPPCKGEHAGLLAWQWQRCREAGVKFEFQTELTTEIIEQKKADKVIVATGAQPLRPPICGIEGQHVLTACEALLGAQLGDRVIVAGGGAVGVETACHLAMQGKTVTIIEMRDTFVAEEDERIRAQEEALMDRLRITRMPNTKLKEIAQTGVVVEQTAEQRFLEADNVVLALGYRADDGLFRALECAGIDAELVGDAKRARKLVDAMREGYLAGRRI